MRVFKLMSLFLIFFAMLGFTIDSLVAQDSLPAAPPQPVEVRLSTEVDKQEVPRNRTVRFIAKLEWSGDIGRFEIVESRNPGVDNFEIIKNAQAHQSSVDNGVPVARTLLEFTLKPLSLGMGYVGDMPVRYRDKLTGEERQLLTTRLGVKVIDPVPEPGSHILFLPKHIFFLVLIVILVIGLALWIVPIILKKRAAERKRREELASIVPLEQSYLEQLKEEVDLNASDLGAHFSLISRIYRKYLAEKFSIPAMELTSRELSTLLGAQNGDEKFLNDTHEILHTCDVVKFGGSQLSTTELARIYTLVENIFERNLNAVQQQSAENAANAD